MKRSNRLILLIGIFLALVAFILVIAVLQGGGGSGGGVRPSAAPTTAKVVVATANIDLGETMTESNVGLKEIPIDTKPADSYGDTALVIGKVARTPVTSGQLINSTVTTDSGTVKVLDVPPGFVAMSVQVDQVSGVGTIIKSGDFVDVVTGFTGTDKVPLVTAVAGTATGSAAYAPEGLLYNPTTVKVISQGLQVLGTLLPPPPAEQAQASAAPTSGTTTLNGQQQIVILAVPTQDAEVIRFAQMDGTISLVLRSSKDCTTKPAEGATYCPVVTTTGITLRRLVDDHGVVPPTVVQVVQPTPIPGSRPKP